MLYPNNIKKDYKKITSFSNRGMDLEYLIEQANEYLIEMRTKLSKFNMIEKIVKENHDYEVCEISYVEILGANKEFLNWIEEELKK